MLRSINICMQPQGVEGAGGGRRNHNGLPGQRRPHRESSLEVEFASQAITIYSGRRGRYTKFQPASLPGLSKLSALLIGSKLCLSFCGCECKATLTDKWSIRFLNGNLPLRIISISPSESMSGKLQKRQGGDKIYRINMLQLPKFYKKSIPIFMSWVLLIIYFE